MDSVPCEDTGQVLKQRLHEWQSYVKTLNCSICPKRSEGEWCPQISSLRYHQREPADRCRPRLSHIWLSFHYIIRGHATPSPSPTTSIGPVHPSPRTEAADQGGASALSIENYLLWSSSQGRCATAEAAGTTTHCWKICSRSSAHHDANTPRRGILPSLTPQRKERAVWLDE